MLQQDLVPFVVSSINPIYLLRNSINHTTCCIPLELRTLFFKFFRRTGYADIAVELSELVTLSCKLNSPMHQNRKNNLCFKVKSTTESPIMFL